MKYETIPETSLVFSVLFIPHGFIGNILCSHSFLSLIKISTFLKFRVFIFVEVRVMHS
jgi:hypothetical protein